MELIQANSGETMRLNIAEQRPVRSDGAFHGQDGGDRPLMTPARRAALEALEREFAQLLQAHRALAT